MASIEIRGEHSTVALSEPDEDGCYGRACTCGVVQGGTLMIADAIAEAEVHVDIQCESETPGKAVN